MSTSGSGSGATHRRHALVLGGRVRRRPGAASRSPCSWPRAAAVGRRSCTGCRSATPIEATRPLQDFPLVLGADRYVLLAGGIGVTALVAMARTLARLGADYRDRLRRPVARGDGVRRPARGRARRPACRCTSTRTGTPLDVQPLIDRIAADPGRTELLMCGPVRLMDAVRRAWHAGRPVADRPALRDVRQQRLVRRRAVRGQRARARDQRDRLARADDARRAERGRGRDDVGLPQGRVRAVRDGRDRARTAASTTATSSSATGRRRPTAASASASPG